MIVTLSLAFVHACVRKCMHLFLHLLSLWVLHTDKVFSVAVV